MKMRNSGRINLLALGLSAGLVLFVGAFLLAKEDASNSAATFMDALCRRDVDKLVELSYIGKTDPTEIEKEKKKLKEQWDFAVNTAGKHFLFVWRISASTKASETRGSVTLQINKSPMSGGYDEKFELPMELEGGKWKVDVGGISSEMFPALPQV